MTAEHFLQIVALRHRCQEGRVALEVPASGTLASPLLDGFALPLGPLLAG